MLDSRVKIEGESISGSGANIHADVHVSGGSRGIPDIFADRSAAKVNPLVRIHYSYDDITTGAHEDASDHTRASANFIHGQGEGNCDSVAFGAIQSRHKRTTNDDNVGSKKRKTSRFHQADDPPENPLAESCSSADTLSHGSCADHLSSGNYTVVFLKKEASNVSDVTPVSSSKKPDSDNPSEETADEEQLACQGLERFCLERESQLLNPGESSLEELVVRSNLSMLELMSKRDTLRFDPGLICLPLSEFKPHQEDRSLDHTPAYIKNRSTQGVELQRLNTTIVPGRASRKALSIGEPENPSNHTSPQDLNGCAATLQSQNDLRVDGESRAQREKDNSHSSSESCADESARTLQSTNANAVDHNLEASNHERFTQPANRRSLLVEPNCEINSNVARSANSRVDTSCLVCLKTCLSLSHLTVHMRTHTGEKPFACSECDKSFSQSGSLALHMRIHTGEKPFVCSECDKSFSQSGSLALHMRIHTGEKPFVCSECDRSFSQSGDLTVHMRIHTGEKPFVCAECDKRFARNGHLAVHMRRHTGEKPFACAECDKRFSHRSSLTLHTRSHTCEKQFACAECDKRFPRRGHLTVHMRIHTGGKPFVCAECDKRFAQNGHLAVHMRRHTGEKPFACAECDKRFSHRSSLTLHMRSHTGEKPFACAECGKKFSRGHSLTLHTRSHTCENQFACAECDKRFSRRCHLTVHMRIHTGGKPFACAECDKRFSNRSSLTLHMRSHTGEKSLACRSDCLTDHMRRHARE